MVTVIAVAYPVLRRMKEWIDERDQIRSRCEHRRSDPNDKSDNDPGFRKCLNGDPGYAAYK